MTTTSTIPIAAPSRGPAKAAGLWRKIIGATALSAITASALLLQGCTAVKIGYQALPEVSYWWLDNYFDFTSDQTPKVKDELAALQRWHRKSELPQIAELLDRMSLMAVTDVTADQMCAVADQVRQRLHAVATQAESPVAALALAITPDQLQALRKRYEKNNADYRKEWITMPVAKRDDKRFKKIVDYGETLYGKLDASQRTIIRRYVTTSGFDPVYDNELRLRQQRDVLQTLERLQEMPQSPGDAKKAVAALMDRSFEPTDASVRAHIQAFRRAGCEAMAETHNSTSDTQRAHAVKRLQGYRQDAAELASRS